MFKAPFRYFLIAAILLALVGGARPAWHGLQRGLQARRVRQASTLFEQGDYRGAYLLAQQALAHNPASREAIGLMIRLSQKTGSPEILFWKQRLAQLQPNDPALRIDLALTAVQFDQPAMASQALSSLPASARQTPSFEQAAAALAISAHQYNAAAQHFDRALQLSPKDPSLRYNLANMRIKSEQPDAIEKARAELEALRALPDWRTPALRSLLAEARMRKDDSRAMQLAIELNRQPDALATDHLLYLEELQHAASPEFDSKLQAFAATCTHSVESAYALLTWMNAHGLAARSFEWGEKLPIAVRLQNPIPMAIAESALQLGSWSKLSSLLNDTNWGSFDFMRTAFQARLVEQTQGNRSLFQAKWDAARAAAGSDPNALDMLVRVAEGWGWKEQVAQLWWQQAYQAFGHRTALLRLQDYYESTHDTRQLYRVSQRVLEMEPGNLGARNNLAYYGLLLGQDLTKAEELAHTNYEQSPNEPALTATYALALLRQKRPREALELMAKLPEAFLQQPSVSACYGAILAACGDFTKARPYLISASNHRAELLPEETALSEQAIRSLP